MIINSDTKNNIIKMEVPCHVCSEWKTKDNQTVMEQRAVGKDKRSYWICDKCHDSKFHKEGNGFGDFFCVKCNCWATETLMKYGKIEDSCLWVNFCRYVPKPLETHITVPTEGFGYNGIYKDDKYGADFTHSFLSECDQRGLEVFFFCPDMKGHELVFKIIAPLKFQGFYNSVLKCLHCKNPQLQEDTKKCPSCSGEDKDILCELCITECGSCNKVIGCDICLEKPIRCHICDFVICGSCEHKCSSES